MRSGSLPWLVSPGCGNACTKSAVSEGLAVRGKPRHIVTADRVRDERTHAGSS
jgi:hypothetical protein